MRLINRFAVTVSGACGAAIFASCTAYAPLADFWPPSDASTPSQGNSSGASDGMDAGEAAVATSGGSGNSTSGSGASSSGGNSGVGSGSASGSQDSGGMTIDAGNADSAAPPEAGVGGSGMGCSLSVSVTTVAANGGYAPSNIGAIWIGRGSGAFVKTLEVWARQRIGHLTLWNSTTRAAKLSSNTVDAITGATISSHKTHQVSWNCTDASRKPVPDGPYRVYFEMTDDNVSGPNMFVDFTKGPMPLTLTPPDATNFKSIKLVFTP